MIKKSDILIIDKENGSREWLLMLTQERYRLITEAVEKNQAVTVEQLVNEIGASAATIRSREESYSRVCSFNNPE